jgi:hypothetical protein
MKGESFHLLLDSYSDHRMMDVKAFAVQLRITLHYIPAGGADQIHPLELLIVGA